MTIKPFYKWYDFYVGAYWNGRKKKLYLVVLGFGIRIRFGPRKLTWAEMNAESHKRG